MVGALDDLNLVAALTEAECARQARNSRADNRDSHSRDPVRRSYSLSPAETVPPILG